MRADHLNCGKDALIFRSMIKSTNQKLISQKFCNYGIPEEENQLTSPVLDSEEMAVPDEKLNENPTSHVEVEVKGKLNVKETNVNLFKVKLKNQLKGMHLKHCRLLE